MNPFDDEVVYNDPSFGVACLSRTCGAANLFGSSVNHQHYISLTIRTAKLTRSNLHDDRIYGGEEIVRVAMSAVQLGELLTNMNVSEGVPCTIERRMVDGHYISIKHAPSVVSNKKTFEDEFKEKAEKCSRILEDLIKMSRDLEAKPSTTKAERRELTNKIEKVQTEIRSNMPFMVEQFNECIEKVVGEAKGEIESYRAAVIERAGMASLLANETVKQLKESDASVQNSG